MKINAKVNCTYLNTILTPLDKENLVEIKDYITFFKIKIAEKCYSTIFANSDYHYIYAYFPAPNKLVIY